MADISKITLPSNEQYNIKDATARSSLAGKQDIITVDGVLQGDGEGNITAAASSTADTLNNPASDGTYVLKNTVSSGTSTLSWESGGGGSGSVTSVGISNATNGGLSISGSPVTDSGTITIGHSNVLTSAQTTQAVYPIKIDKNGHISAYGSAVTIPTSTASATTGVSIADHSTSTIYGVQSSTITASKASGANGSAPTLGTAFTIPNVTAVGSGSFTSGSFNGGSGSFSATVTNHVLSFSHTHTAATHGADSHTHTAPSLGTAFTVPNVTNAGSASTWSFSDVTVPIKDTDSTTVVTSKTHSVTDNGHTHTLS